MNNRISLLAFESEQFDAKAAAGYESIFGGADNAVFERFKDIRAMFNALAKAFKESETVVLAVPEDSFIQIKKLLFAALKIKTEVSEQLSELCGEDSDFSVMPVGARILATGDGKYSGFIQKSGKQTLVFLPLSISSYTELEDELKEIFCDKETVTDIEEKCNPEEVVERLRQNGVCVAVASSKSSPFVFSVLPQDDETDFSEVIFSRSVDSVRRENESHKEFAASCAGLVRSQSEATLGVSISNVFLNQDGEGEFFLLMCIADKEIARVFKLFSRPGETSQEFIYACVHRLYSALDEYAGSGFIVEDPCEEQPIAVGDLHGNERHIPSTVEISHRSRKKTAILVAAIVLFAVLIGTAVTFFVKGYGDKDRQSGVDGSSSSADSSEDTSDDGDFLDAIGDMIFADIENTDSASESETQSNSEKDTEKSETKVELSSSAGTTLSRLTEVSTLLTTGTTAAVTKPKPTTTTTTATTNQKPTTTTTKSSKKSGTFVFTVYGYGHGVGMSQNGASAYAKSGWDYKRILLHYYYASGISLERDTDLPEKVTYNGKSYTLTEYLGKTAYAEVGPSAPLESIKSQMVAIYTYAKRQNFKMTTSNHAFRESYNGTSTSIETAIKETLGDYLAYNGKPAFTPYFSTSAGVTASSSNVWGGAQSSYPYLSGGRTSPETDIKRTLTVTSEELRQKVEKYNASVDSSKRITLQDDPAQWIKILSHDSARSSSCGYISSIQIGNQTMRGNAFRLNIMGASTLRSHCFTFTYTPD